MAQRLSHFSRSGFYDYLNRFRNPKDRPEEAALQKRIKEIFDKSKGSYGSRGIAKQFEPYGMEASMSRKGNCWDNAPTERFFRSLKSERLTEG